MVDRPKTTTGKPAPQAPTRGAAPRPAAKPTPAPAAKPTPKPAAKPAEHRVAAPSKAQMPNRIDLTNVHLPAALRQAPRLPTYTANQQRAGKLRLPHAPANAKQVKQVRKEKPGFFSQALAWGKGAARDAYQTTKSVAVDAYKVGKDVGRGAGAAVKDAVTGVIDVVTNPVETVEGVAHLVRNPGKIKDVAVAMYDDVAKHGTAYAVGYVGANLAPMLLSGGGSGAATAGRVLSVASKARMVRVVARVPAVLRAADRVGDLAKAAKATRVVKTLVKTGEQARAVAARPAATVSRAKKAIAESRVVRQARVVTKRSAVGRATTKVVKVVEKPVQQARALRQRLHDRAVGLAEKGIKQADDKVMATKTAQRLEAYVDKHTLPDATPAYSKHAAQALATIARTEAARGPSPIEKLATKEDFAPLDREIDRLAEKHPERLDEAIVKALRKQGFTDREIALVRGNADNWIRQMDTPGVGEYEAFEQSFHGRMREATEAYQGSGRIARAEKGPGAYAAEGGHYREVLADAHTRIEGMSPAEAALYQERVDLAVKMRATRNERRKLIAEDLGVKPVDATHVRGYRGTAFPDTVHDIHDAWRVDAGGKPDTWTRVRHADSYSLDPDVAVDFPKGGRRSKATQGRDPADAYVVLQRDIPLAAVDTDKYSDLSGHALSSPAQRTQQEFVVGHTDAIEAIDPRNAYIGFKDRLYSYEERHELFAAIEADPEAWARAVPPRKLDPITSQEIATVRGR